MYPDVDHVVAHQLVANDTFSRFQLLVNDTPRMAKPLNTMLLEQGGWPLFVIFYGIFFTVIWLVFYFSLKPFFEKEKGKEKL